MIYTIISVRKWEPFHLCGVVKRRGDVIIVTSQQRRHCNIVAMSSL